MSSMMASGIISASPGPPGTGSGKPTRTVPRAATGRTWRPIILSSHRECWCWARSRYCWGPGAGTRGRSAAGEEEVGGEGGERRWRGKRFPLGGSPGKQLHSFGPSPCSAWACWETQAAPARRPTLSSCSKTFLVVGRLVLPLAMHNLFPGSGLSPIGHPGGTRWESPRLLLPLGGLLAESSV